MTSAVELLGCPVCGSLINVQVMRLVMMYHCNECGSEITASAWNSANRADRVLQKRINRMQEALIAESGAPAAKRLRFHDSYEAGSAISNHSPYSVF